MKMLSKMRKNEKGFTLIELIVVIAILAILAAIAIPRLAGFTENARQATDKEKAALVANAGAAWFAQHSSDNPVPTLIDPATLIAAGLIVADDIVMESKGYGAATSIVIGAAANVANAAGHSVWVDTSGGVHVKLTAVANTGATTYQIDK